MLIFTPELAQQAEPSRDKHYRRLIHRWTIDERHAGLREQLERAASSVPIDRRGRVLGPLTGKSSSNEQVRTAAGSLLLGKTLADLDWCVEFEPAHAGGTPDLRIAKGDAEFVVEVRSIFPPKSYPEDDAVARIQDALIGIETRTPLLIRAANVPGSASLKAFATFVRQLVVQSPPPEDRRHTFNQDSVLVVLEGSLQREGFDEPVPVIGGSIQQPVFGGQHDQVRAAIGEKLSTYKAPLIVALDFFDPMDAFSTTEEVLLGREAMFVSVALTDDAPFQPPRAGRATDGMLHHRGREGDRARERLQTVLPFSLSATESGALELRGRIMSNPGAEVPLKLQEFAPMPRLAVIAEDADGTRALQYLDERDQVIEPERLRDWQHVP